MPTVLRDLSDTSGYWAAIWTICPMPDVHVVCDAPIGCFNLVGTAVSDYTDAIPHIDNLTPSTITEREVSGKGTGPTLKWTIDGLVETGALGADKRLIVVSTAESEMIGADHEAYVGGWYPGARFYYCNSLAEDEWAGRDRVLRWLWRHYGAERAASVEPGTVNIIGPTYGCFNAPSDLEEVKRLIVGAGGRVNLVYPYESTLAGTPRLGAGQVNVCLYREFGAGLAADLGQPTLFAPFGLQETTDFVRELGRLLGTAEQAEAFIAREKRTTLRTIWDLWRGPQGDWFCTTDVGIVASRSYADGLARFLGDELGMPIRFVVARPRQDGQLDNEGIRQVLHTKPPAFVFGSINERIYLSEVGARFTNWIPAAFPGPIVRRAVGTPFMGFRGAVYVVQDIVNRLYDTLYAILPVDAAYTAKAGPGGPPAAPAAPTAGNLRWAPDAKAALDEAVERLPYISRISASRELQLRVEAAAAQRGAAEVTVEIVTAAIASAQR